MPGKIIISKITDPYINLALEDFFFRNSLSEDCPNILFLYQNTPCVVIGRAQNPWEEANLDYNKKNNIHIIRRQSGGGTVFHDLGNLNYSFIALNNYYLVDQHLRIITQALNKLEIEAFTNKRNDILINIDDSEKKISGSAFRKAKDRSFHHATLLVKSDIDQLIKSIESAHNIKDAKGVKSIRSKVANLNEIIPSLTIDMVINSISNIYAQQHNIDANNNPEDIIIINNQLELNKSLNINNNLEIIEKYKSEIKSKKWTFEKTLSFEIHIPLSINQSNTSYIICHVNHGKTQEFTFTNKKNINKDLNADIKIVVKTLNKYCKNINIYEPISNKIKTKIMEKQPDLRILFHNVFLFINKYS